MKDKELLELAAKAAEIEYWVVRFAPKSNPIEKLHITKNGETVEWTPLTDDGDALRLAVKLKLFIDLCYPDKTCGWVGDYESGVCKTLDEPGNNDPYAATRRAIVRAAAVIGKSMEDKK